MFEVKKRERERERKKECMCVRESMCTDDYVGNNTQNVTIREDMKLQDTILYYHSTHHYNGTNYVIETFIAHCTSAALADCVTVSLRVVANDVVN